MSKKTSHRVKKITARVRAYAKRIVAPEGFTRIEREGYARAAEEWGFTPNGQHDVEGYLSVVLASEDIVLIFRLREETRSDGLNYRTMRHKNPCKVVGYGGTTLFKTQNHGWLSFDRTGVCDSFSSPWRGELPDPATVIEEQIRRVKEHRERTANYISVPVLGYRIAPETRDEYSKKLKAGGTVSFTPAGFGQGHYLTARRKYHYSTRAAKELAEFFGLTELWLETFDCD